MSRSKLSLDNVKTESDAAMPGNFGIQIKRSTAIEKLKNSGKSYEKSEHKVLEDCTKYFGKLQEGR